MGLFNIPKRKEIDIVSVINKATALEEYKPKIKLTGTSLMDRLSAISKTVKENLSGLEGTYLIINNDDDWLEYCRNAIKDEYIAIDTETNSLDSILCKITGVCIQSTNQKPAYVPINHISVITETNVPDQVSIEAIKQGIEIINKGKSKLIFHNYYYDAVVVYMATGMLLPCYWDTLVASCLLNENEPHNLKYLYDRYVMKGKAGVHKFNELFDGLPINVIPYKIAGIYGAHDAVMTMDLFLFQLDFLNPENELCKKYRLERVAKEYRETELPCLDALVSMKINGIEYDLKRNRELKVKYEELKEEAYSRYINICAEIKNDIYAYNMCNQPIEYPPNYKSPQQLAALFYNILEAKPPTKKKKDNHTTGKKALKYWMKTGNKLLKELASAVTDVKAYDKCISDFIDKLYDDAVLHGGKIFGNFKLNGAKTNRMSSNSPKQLGI